MRPIGIDLFSGAGGLSLGFEQAGFDISAAVEIDPIHCAVHKYNFPDTTVIPQSVETVTGTEIREKAKLGRRRVDCVFGGAPCQGFSLIGHRMLDDPRNKLVKDFVRIVSELDTRYFVFENVKGLTVGKHKAVLSEIVDEFDKVGYDVLTPWQVLNAAQFATPQNRQRLILIGAKRGEKLPSYPEPITNASGRKLILPELPVGPTCEDALSDLLDVDEYEELLSSDEITKIRLGKPSAYASDLRCRTNKGWYFGYQRSWNKNALTSSARTVHTEISRNRFASTEQGEVEPISRFFRLPHDGVSNTLRAGTDGARGAFTSPRPIHYKFNRCITVREMARLHGFPDWFRLHSTKWHGARQVGNAVPPPLARAVANELIKIMGHKIEKPENRLKLGETALLSMDMTQAANHFGVEAPLNKRDRKSGAKKRKQEDIERERTSAFGDAAYV